MQPGQPNEDDEAELQRQALRVFLVDVTVLVLCLLAPIVLVLQLGVEPTGGGARRLPGIARLLAYLSPVLSLFLFAAWEQWGRKREDTFVGRLLAASFRYSDLEDHDRVFLLTGIGIYVVILFYAMSNWEMFF